MKTEVYVSCSKESLPGPRDALELDLLCGDAELFERFFGLLGNVDFRCLGDLWCDVLGLQLAGFLTRSIHFHFTCF